MWCSPGFSEVDVWIPVIKKLKEKGNIRIDFVFPEPSSLLLEDKNSDLFKISEQFSDNCIYRGYSDRWFIAPTLTKAYSGIKFSNIDEKIESFSIRLIKGRISKLFLMKTIGKYLLTMSKYLVQIKEDMDKNPLNNWDLLSGIDGIFCDITKENKIGNKELKYRFKNVQKFSMFHGVTPHWERTLKCDFPAKERSDVVVYSMSDLETNGYKKCFGILGENIITVGVPRHDNDWIEFLVGRSKLINEIEFDSFVFLISRPASPYNTIERKRKALKDIYNTICIKHGLKLVLKKHPKESINGVDARMYMEVFGLENYGKTWVYSNSHAFVLGSKAIFAVSFYSGISIDMLAINKPTIEYLDLSNLDLYDNSHSLRGKYGEPVFEYRYLNLVLGARSNEEFDRHVDSILNQPKKTISSLRSRYENFFKISKEASEIVANDIYNKL
jgi:hypothetical protein